MSDVCVGLCGKLKLVVCAAIYLSLQVQHTQFSNADQSMAGLSQATSMHGQAADVVKCDELQCKSETK